MTLGTRQQSLDQQGSRQSAVGSLIGATEGTVTLRTGAQYQQIGSQVVAPKGDVDLLAGRIDLIAARHTWDQWQQQHFKQTGLSLSLTNPIVSALQTSQKMVDAAGQVDDPRFKLLAGATTGLATKNASFRCTPHR